MRVCMVGYTFYDSDTRLIQYASALVERGDTVDVICLAHPGQPPQERVRGVSVHRIQTRLVNERSKWSYLIRVLRFLVHSTVMLARSSSRYDVVHVHSVPDFLVLSGIAPKLRGAKAILDIHDILPEFYCSKFGVSRASLMFRVLLLVERVSIAVADHVIVANDLWRPRLLDRSCAPDKCTAICNYPDPELFRRRLTSSRKKEFRILYPGTLNWHQGVDIAIRAFAKAVPSIPDAEFHIYGDGPSKPDLIALTREHHIRSKVHFHDTVPLERVAAAMSEADLGVVPKRAESAFGNEAISTKVLQFMAAGVPVIVSRTAVDTYYHDDSRVRFFASGNVDELAECMVQMRHNDDLRRSLIDGASAYLEKNNWSVRKHEYLSLLDRIRNQSARAVLPASQSA